MNEQQPEIAAIFGPVLARARRKAGLTQEDLAFETELHPTYISQVERGIKSPTLRTLFKMADAMGIKPSSLVKSVERQLQ
nr:hypothetical protein 12 [Candidatus Hydrogenedentota bacterium]